MGIGKREWEKKVVSIDSKGKKIDMEMMFNKNRIKDRFFSQTLGDRINLDEC